MQAKKRSLRKRTTPANRKEQNPIDRAELPEVMVAADVAFNEKFETWVKYIYARDRHLNLRDKELVVTGILCALRASPNHIQEHMAKAQRAGATKKQLIVVAQLVGAWGGTVAQANATEAWRLQFMPHLPGIFEPVDK